MKIFLPLLMLLTACKPQPPDLSAITTELTALRHGLDEVRKLNQPRLEAVEAMDDLAREVKRLRQKVANPPQPPAPLAGPALAGGGPAIRMGELAGGVGGTQAGINDLYRALPGGRGLQLDGVRMLNADIQIIEYNSNKPRVMEIQEVLEKQKK